MQAAASLRAAFPDAVVFVPLAPLRDAALVPSAIAHAAGVGEAADVPLLDSLASAWQGQRILLVLDKLPSICSRRLRSQVRCCIAVRN